MPSSSTPSRNRIIAFALGLVAATAATSVLFRELRHDDAFITFQYAFHLGSGTGFTFNPGERELGATSPLHVLLLAPVGALSKDLLPVAAVVLGSLGLALQALFVFLLLRSPSRLLAALCALLVLAGAASSHSWLSLETDLFAALALLCLWSLTTQPGWLTGALLGLAFLCRPDAALLVPIAVGVAWTRERRFPLRMLIACAAVSLPWLAWATSYFGTFVPNTFFAKKSVTPPGVFVVEYARYFAEEPWRGLGASATLRWLTPALWVSGLAFLLRHARALVPFALFAVALFAGYTWIGPPAVHQWHLYTVELFLTLLAILGVFGWALVLPRPRWRAASIAGLAAVALVAWREVRFAQSLPDDFWLGRRHRMYSTVAEWMKGHVRPGATLLAYEVGTIGFLNQHRMIDPFGLINQTNDFPRSPSLANLEPLIEHYQPDLVLGVPGCRALEARTPYRVVQTFDSQGYWSTLLARDASVLVTPAAEQ